MADWSLPSLSSLWADFLDLLKARDFDASSMGYSSITNPITGMMRYVRADNKFQTWNGSAWVDLVLAVAGGGTGGATAGDARTALGLGTMAVQNSNNVSITGGFISGLGGLSVNGDIVTGSNLGVTGNIGATGSISTVAGFGGPGTSISTLNASALSVGTVPVARLGTGAVGSGLLALLDNNTWGPVNMLAAARNETISFGSSATFQDVKDVNLSAFPGFTGVTDIKEIAVFMNHGSRIERTSTGVEVSIAWQVLNTTPTVRFRRESITGAGTILAEDINFTFWKVRVG